MSDKAAYHLAGACFLLGFIYGALTASWWPW